MAEETTNEGYLESEAYAQDPASNDAPDSTYQDFERGINSYNLARAGETAALAAIISADTGNGRVGIGTTSPNYDLHVEGSDSTVGFQLTNTTTGDTAGDGFLAQMSGVNLALLLREVGKIAFYTSNTQRAEIDAYGNLLVGKTSSNGSVVGTEIQDDGQLVITRDGGRPLYINRLNSDGALVEFVQDNSIRGSISIAGSTTAYNTSSDYRLKENVVPLTGATDRIKQLNPSKFNFITSPDKIVDGFIAHEVAEVVPEAVTGAKDAMADQEVLITPATFDDAGNELTAPVYETQSLPSYQGIDQAKLVPLLVATIQELEARITALEA